MKEKLVYAENWTLSTSKRSVQLLPRGRLRPGSDNPHPMQRISPLARCAPLARMVRVNNMAC